MIFYNIVFGILAFLSFVELFSYISGRSKKIIIKITVVILIIFQAFILDLWGIIQHIKPILRISLIPI